MKSPVLIRNNDKIITFYFCYPFEYRENESFLYNVLIDLLNERNFEASAPILFENKLYKYNIMDYDVELNDNKLEDGDITYLIYTIEIPNPKELEIIDLDKTLSYILKTISLDVNLDDIDTFLNNEKERYNNEEQMKAEDISELVIDDIEDYIYNKKESAFERNIRLIDEGNIEDLLRVYKRLKSNSPYVFISGNIEELELQKMGFEEKEINKSSLKILKKTVEKDYFEVEKNIDRKQSVLASVYKIDDYEEKDYKVFMALSSLLLKEEVIYQELRCINDAIYSEVCSFYSKLGIFSVFAFTDQEGLSICINVLNEVMTKLQDDIYVEDMMNKAKKQARIDSLRSLDVSFIKNMKIINEQLYSNKYSYEEEVQNVDVDDVKKLIKRIRPYYQKKYRGED